MPWRAGLAEWIDGDTAYLSVPFTWSLQNAHMRAVALRCEGYRVHAGGPAVSLMPDFLAEVAEIGGEVNALPHHNPDATFTSRGCIRRCPFCAVPKIEGAWRDGFAVVLVNPDVAADGYGHTNPSFVAIAFLTARIRSRPETV